jgi:2Fe-2S ferredoxin
MPQVKYIEFDGEEFLIDLPEGWTLMQGATLNGVEGIVGECGGSCGCATCHVYVDDSFLDKLEPPTETEEEMLEVTVSPREHNSRLGCQIKARREIDGIVVRLPEAQVE